MSDDSDDDNLFADSDEDTDELISKSNTAKPIAKPKKRLQKKSAPKKRKRADIPDADNDSDDEGGPGMFDSDNEGDKKPKKVLSKKERMEALRAKKRQESGADDRGDGGKKKEDGYDSGDSYNSAEYVRTQADMDFIDTEGDDAEAINELYSEQKFDDERGEAMEEPKKKKKIKGAGSSRGRSERQELEAESRGDEDNPMMQVVNRMKKKKRVQKKFGELEEEAKEFIARMETAADEDEEAIGRKQPAFKKLSMLTEVCDMLARRDMMRVILDLDVLAVCGRWIKPLKKDGTLGNVTIRSRLLQAISLMTGENGISAMDLKRTDFGKVCMSLYMHVDETPAIKRQLKSMIELWSRPIFQKSGNMRDLERVHHSRGGGGLAGIARSQNQEMAAARAPVAQSAHRGGKDQDLNSLIKSGAKGKSESGINRVRVPFSKGFQFTVRPMDKTSGTVDSRRSGPVKESRGNLSKRMKDKGRSASKNQRSANVSVEGRAVK